jgi:transposase InsO family protein
MTRQRRSFDPSFKLEVVKTIKEQGLSVQHVSGSMNIGPTAIRRWVEQYDAEQSGQPGIGRPLTPEQQRINPAAPNKAYVSDITYIRTGAGWLYLAVVIDLFSRKVIGWAMAPSMPAKLVCDALHMAIQQRRPGLGKR